MTDVTKSSDGSENNSVINHLYGPVPSRRLRLSLGVDVVPFKYCSLDCIYCQLGRTTNKTVERKEFFPVEQILQQLRERIGQGLQADYITIGGSGEPTLYSQLGVLLDEIKKITTIKTAVLTNSTLFSRDDVRADCAKADVVLPSLDAADSTVFGKINRPAADVSFDSVVDGLIEFRKNYTGQIWLEVFMIKKINTDAEQIEKFKALISRIAPDKVHLNTAVRPTAEPGIEIVGSDWLSEIADKLGPGCEVIADFASVALPESEGDNRDRVLSVLKRRPCSLDDVHNSLGITRNELLKILGSLESEGLVSSERKNSVVFYKAGY